MLPIWNSPRGAAKRDFDRIRNIISGFGEVVNTQMYLINENVKGIRGESCMILLGLR